MVLTTFFFKLITHEKEEKQLFVIFAGKSGEETTMLPGAQALTVRLARLASSRLLILLFTLDSTCSGTREAL